MYKIKEVADFAGISIRTLHHYDHIGLLQPAETTEAGYRLYTKENLERLQQILFFKEIGFSLQEIKEILDRPNFDRKKALENHRELLLKKKQRLETMLQTVQKTIQSLEGGIEMSGQDLFKGFDMSEIEEHQKKYSEEAKQRYGKERVEAVEKRTSQYTKEDWARIQATTEDIYRRIAERMDHEPSDPEVQKAVAEWRQFITDHYYDCTLEIFRGLGDLYVDDPRFTKNIDKFQPGLAKFLREAMHYYCDQQEK